MTIILTPSPLGFSVSKSGPGKGVLAVAVDAPDFRLPSSSVFLSASLAFPPSLSADPGSDEARDSLVASAAATFSFWILAISANDFESG